MNVRTLAALIFASLIGLGSFAAARADGEAGLVIQDGDTVQTYCVPFKGDSISGADLLDAAGVGFEQVGGASRTVCSIGSTGCHDAGDFASCFCKCQGADCVYWAFFTQKHGQGWVYASLAFNLLRAKDGDLQGWKWGKGNPNSAPAPSPITFETVCGHAPNGGLATPAAATPTVTLPTATTTVSSSTATTAAASTAPSSATSEASPPPSAAASVATLPATGVPARSTAAPPGATPVKPPATGESGGGSGGVDAGLIAFGAITAGLVLAIGGVIAWRQRHGA